MNNTIITVHCIAHVLCALWFYKKEKLSIRSFLWIYISLFCIGGVFLLNSGKYFYLMEYPHFSEGETISAIPYLLNFVFTFIILQTWRDIGDSSLCIEVKKQSVNTTTIILVVEFIGISYIILKMWQFSVTMQFGMGVMHDLGQEKIDDIFYSSFKPLMFINYLGRFNNLILLPYVITYRFLGYKQGLHQFKKVANILLLYALCSISTGMVSGSRAIMLFAVLNVAFFCVIFWRWIPQKHKKILVGASISIAIIFILIFAVIGGERNHNHTGMENVLRYWGESYLNIGHEFYNHIQNHADGIFCFRNLLDNVDLKLIVEITGVNVWWFTTLYGSLFIDFGLVLPFVFPFLLWLGIAKCCSGRGQIKKLGNVSILHYLFSHSYWIPFGFHISYLDIFSIMTMILLPKILDKYFVK